VRIGEVQGGKTSSIGGWKKKACGNEAKHPSNELATGGIWPRTRN